MAAPPVKVSDTGVLWPGLVPEPARTTFGPVGAARFTAACAPTNRPPPLFTGTDLPFRDTPVRVVAASPLLTTVPVSWAAPVAGATTTTRFSACTSPALPAAKFGWICKVAAPAPAAQPVATTAVPANAAMTRPIRIWNSAAKRLPDGRWWETGGMLFTAGTAPRRSDGSRAAATGAGTGRAAARSCDHPTTR